ncbi:MAG: single-stranded DNA-binding protein [Crenarchaeota archaeon]|nr:MAG: single-stranded DNA-binding protein [Thermoproteota archaeon]RDJ33382.1 MAG: single-stranded DNA-binding protein [Thermoproteota archaeon]RDJ36113.1 MAG: single-stranded DNA-binding protein [Thermoproteota archaeon]RDJ38746.1 MAG: single-stranded DNA-binding protein [Thermoproteota archaeon]
MSEFESLIEKLLEQKPDLSKTDVEEMIKQKKEKIGAGYLTDQGALFLIASDYGITLSEPPKTEMNLKDLYVGAKEISLQTRVLNMSPAKQYSRKDGSPFFLRTMTVYDGDSTASVKLWDEKAKLPAINQLKPGDLIKIIKAYVKSDFNGLPTINVGSGSSIESTDEDSSIPSIESITKDVSEIQEGQKDLVVSGLLDGPITSMQFTNSRGQPGSALRLRLKGKDGNSTRIVLWGKNDEDIPKVVAPNTKVRLLGTKVKTGTQGLEIHGNESTIMDIEGTSEIKPIVTRIISITTNESGNKMVIGVDKEKNLFNITDFSENLNQFSEGDMIECMPSKLFGNAITVDSDSFVRRVDDDPSIPTREKTRTKISDVKVGESYCIEAIVLKIPERREIQTKTGEMVLLGEMFVEDDSGQIWVKGWRNQARLIDKCSIGEIISITGVNAKAGLEGRVELTLSAFSTINKKN